MSCLPDSVHIDVRNMELEGTAGYRERNLEIEYGQNLLKRMAKKLLDISDLQIQRKPNEKPTGKLPNGREIFLGISHTKLLIAGVLSDEYPVAVDIEHSERIVPDALLKRIKNKAESNDLYSHLGLIRIWTIKESALKWNGTGLRIRMNRIRIMPVSENLFNVVFDDGRKVKICSFKKSEHWISVAYG
ncbi:MAG: 4'-phosphopantetheinyl transferase family protein [Balneolaceae bacterium]